MKIDLFFYFALPVFDLNISLDKVCPTRSYCRRLIDSLGQSTEAIGPFLQVNIISLLVYASKTGRKYHINMLKVWSYLSIWIFLDASVGLKYSQLPNRRGQEWPSIGKSIRLIGHSALIVSLKAGAGISL